MSLVYLNGEYQCLAAAKISVLDRGFIFGDSVYEVIPVFGGKVFHAEKHLQRLERSLNAISIGNPLSRQEWKAIFGKLIASVEASEQSIYLQITRGISERDYDTALADTATVFVMTRALVKKDFSQGIKAIIHDDIRWQYCYIKATALLANVILRQRAKAAGAKEAILIRDGQITEGAASNVFICKDNRIMTPPINDNILPGVTRDLLITILQQNNMDCVETAITKAALLHADEIWITSSTWEIVPVITLDEKVVGTGKPGAIWQKVNQLYQLFKDNFNDNHI